MFDTGARVLAALRRLPDEDRARDPGGRGIPSANITLCKGDVRIRYEETGSGFPLLVTPGGGLNSKVSNWPTRSEERRVGKECA